ncbi:MAG: hypothetical protein P8L69_03340 [Alphaproteobacteria bacterium]|nr:hypothetical protein [Alphaproteobacteria bacterium]
MVQIAMLAFEINLKLVRTELSTKKGFFSAAKPPTTDELHAGVQELWNSVDTFVYPKIQETSGNMKRYFYGASMINLDLEDGSHFGNSFLGHSFFFPEWLSEVRVYPMPQNGDPFLDNQIVNLLKQQEQAEEFEVGICYLTDMDQGNAEQLFKDTYLKFNKSQKGEIHLITMGQNHILHFSAADFLTEQMQGSLAGEPRWRIPAEELDQSAVTTFLRNLAINSKGDPFEQQVNEILLTGLLDGNATSVPQTSGDTRISAEIYQFDSDKYPDGIDELMKDLDPEVWDRGYRLVTDEGTWYEVYPNLVIRKIWGDFDFKKPHLAEFKFQFDGFKAFDVSMFGEFGQITFFVPNSEEVYDLDELTNIFY